MVAFVKNNFFSYLALEAVVNILSIAVVFYKLKTLSGNLDD